MVAQNAGFISRGGQLRGFELRLRRSVRALFKGPARQAGPTSALRVGEILTPALPVAVQ
jgi:hypothetical protein